MSMDRRYFLLAGSTVAGGGLTSAAYAAAATGAARSVKDFGVQPNTDHDQSPALQKAIDEISAGARAVYLPGGTYRVGRDIKLPPKCAIIGDPGLTVLNCKIGGGIFLAGENESLHLSGLTLASFAKKGDAADLITFLMLISGGTVSLNKCRMRNGTGGAISADSIAGSIVDCTFSDFNNGALAIRKAGGLRIAQCRFERCWQCGRGLCEPDPSPGVSCVGAEGDGLLITDNYISQCSSGISLRGSGVATGNFVSGVNHFGLKLGGSGDERGTISATGNTLIDCKTGIRVSAGGETILASLNLIVRAKEGAIRASDGDKLVGRDLARESAEMYLNLTVAGNVAR